MFKVVFDGVPTLKMIPLEAIDGETFYLSSDQSTVLLKDGDGEFVVFDLDSRQVIVYHWNCRVELLENHPYCATFYPAETVKVSMAFEISGVKGAN